MDIIKVKRYINYYELDFSFIDNTTISTFFATVTRLAVTRAKIRYQRFGDKYIFIQGITNKDGIINAKVRCVRLDLFPELINMNTDVVTEIEGDEYDGIVETTHILMDCRKSKTTIAVEYNHPGAKIIDIVGYLTRIGIDQGEVEKIGYAPIVNSDLTRLKTRINRISELTMKVHKDNLPKLKKMDGNIFQSAQAATNHFENQYAVLDFKVDYRTFSDTPMIKNSLFNLINFLSENPSDRHIFNYLKVKAEDEEKNNLLETFDLLLDKIYSPVKVQRKRKQKTIISEDMFEKMFAELDKLRLR
ncbi:hypothetical protein FSS13T_25460 [Flavobacterium saliperosum S13]|uniref:Uncharacterized protein n=2 Tax=Flavobacterium saliperosum TaxID=329186 RepID=A0A1G4W5M0_9FLAO|nr:hypothetical protein [Flavobacterium saliperosum]ESU22546.1 hypothetical protein FSS13T_25460 [Flavobacterium saliperosum S13]SCX17125.1 hypothetical protein SAMN02927925_02492 [Flavobacterium saliperosum]